MKTNILEYHFCNDKEHIYVLVDVCENDTDSMLEYKAYDSLADKIGDTTLGRDNPKGWYIDNAYDFE